MKPEFNNQQSDWLNQTEELNDLEAAQLNGGNTAELAARANSLFQQQLDRSLDVQLQTAAAKAARDQSGKLKA